jgi:SAM-dependent methyltransferase
VSRKDWSKRCKKKICNMAEKLGSNDFKSGWKGACGRSSEGIEIWNRDYNSLIARLFPDDPAHISFIQNPLEKLKYSRNWRGGRSYFYYSAGTEFSENHKQHNKIVNTSQAILGIGEFTKKDNVLLDLGCGGGAGAWGLANRNPEVRVIGVDYEMGEKIPFPEHNLPNLAYACMDWRKLEFSDNRFDAVISDKGWQDMGTTMTWLAN